jgi:hypothetical protein
MGYRNIARIYELLNDKEKALENYKIALEKNNDPGMELFIKRKISSLSWLRITIFESFDVGK